MTISVMVKARASARSGDIIDDLCKLATRIDCKVRCKFADVTIFVAPGDRPATIKRAFKKAEASDHAYKVAASSKFIPGQ